MDLLEVTEEPVVEASDTDSQSKQIQRDTVRGSLTLATTPAHKSRKGRGRGARNFTPFSSTSHNKELSSDGDGGGGCKAKKKKVEKGRELRYPKKG